MKSLKQTDDGWAVMSKDGQVLRVVPEFCFMADTKHELALFPGSADSVDAHIESIGRACRATNAKDEMKHLRRVTVGKEVSELEANFMLANYQLPRRVGMRLRRLECAQQP